MEERRREEDERERRGEKRMRESCVEEKRRGESRAERDEHVDLSYVLYVKGKRRAVMYLLLRCVRVRVVM